MAQARFGLVLSEVQAILLPTLTRNSLRNPRDKRKGEYGDTPNRGLGEHVVGGEGSAVRGGKKGFVQDWVGRYLYSISA